MASAWEHAGIVVAGKRLSAIAPIDDGTDADDVGDRLLRAAPTLLDRCLQVQTFDLSWGQPGLPQHRRTFGHHHHRRAFEGHVAGNRSGHILAASYCAQDGSRGFGLWQDNGLIWICWTPQGRAFDTWLLSTIPEFPCEEARH